MDLGQIITSVLGLLGTGGGAIALGRWYLEWRKQSQEFRRDDNSELFKRYRELVDDLKRNLEDMKKEISVLQDAHTQCRVENEALKGEILLLRSRITDVEQGVKNRANDLKGVAGKDENLAGRG